MGKPNLEIEYGDDCLLCYSAGQTPKAFVCTISGVQNNAPYPNINGSFLVKQVSGSPCAWYLAMERYGHTFIISLSLQSLTSHCGVSLTPPPPCFAAYGSGPCSLSFTNGITDDSEPWYDGSVNFIPASTLSYFNYAGGFYPVPTAKLQRLTDEPTKQVIRTVNESDHTNFKIKETF